MKERDCGIEKLLSELPEKYIVKKTIHIGFSPANLASLVGEEDVSINNDAEGIKLIRSGGRLLIVPEKSGENIRVLAEADSAEVAQELCADIEDIIERAEESNL